MCVLTDEEESEMKERLARMETSLSVLSKQMDHMVNLLVRVVKVEEHLEQDRRDMGRLYKRLETIEIGFESLQNEMSRWSTARKIFVWVTGVAGSIVAAAVLWGKQSV